MDLHFHIEGSLQGLVLPLQDRSQEVLTGWLREHGQLYLDVFGVELGAPEGR